MRELVAKKKTPTEYLHNWINISNKNNSINKIYEVKEHKCTY